MGRSRVAFGRRVGTGGESTNDLRGFATGVRAFIHLQLHLLVRDTSSKQAAFGSAFGSVGVAEAVRVGGWKRIVYIHPGRDKTHGT